MKAAQAAVAAADTRGEGEGAEQRGAKRGEASAAQRADAKAAQAAVAEVDARDEGDGAEQRGAKRGEASEAQRKPLKPPRRRPTCEAKVTGLSSAAPSEARRSAAASKNAADAAEAEADVRGEGDGAEQRGAERTEQGELGASRQHKDRRSRRPAVAAADARGKGDGAEQRGAKRGEASAEQRGGAKAAEAA